MHIAVVGTGYVGLVSAACFAELGHHVIGVDIDEEKIRRIQSGKSPIYEPGLEELLVRGMKNGRLTFTTDLREALPKSSFVFSAVATPPGEGHKADLRAVYTVASTVAEHVDHDIIFVNKSTVPVGTGQECARLIQEKLKERGVEWNVPVVSNPEFLREGLAVSDTLMPDRVVVGVNGNPWAEEQMEELYRPITRVGKPLVLMSRESAEIVKYASNSFLATKISFINMLTPLTEKTGANIRDVARGMGLDDRIGPRFLHAGIGYGGSCFPKDVKALLATAKDYDISMDIVEATDKINVRQRQRFIDLLLRELPANSTVAVWGLSFKQKTDDMREAPSLDIIPALLEAGHTVQAYDPEAIGNARKLLPEAVHFTESPTGALDQADALVLLTEWDEFRGANFTEVQQSMRGDQLFDGRNIYDPEEVEDTGLQYYGIGIGNV